MPKSLFIGYFLSILIYVFLLFMKQWSFWDRIYLCIIMTVQV